MDANHLKLLSMSSDQSLPCDRINLSRLLKFGLGLTNSDQNCTVQQPKDLFPSFRLL